MPLAEAFLDSTAWVALVTDLMNGLIDLVALSAGGMLVPETLMTALQELGAADKPTLMVYNKIDLYRERYFDDLLTSQEKTDIETDLRERLGAPVRQGDNLFRVAKLKGLYVVADVPERDIHELRGTESGEIAFYSQPRLKFPIQGRILEPAATTKENANPFGV